MQLVIVTGLSGSGKTSAIHALEDVGFFCIDNLPVLLLPGLVDLFLPVKDRFCKIAVVMDIREGVFLNEYPSALQQVRDRGVSLEVLFLETSTEALLRRYEETRRPHPLCSDRTLLDCIEQERMQMECLKEHADKVVDTTYLNIHQLRETIKNMYSRGEQRPRIWIELISFGYSKGVPSHANIVMDARFLPNPHYHPHLRERDGNDREVEVFVQQDHEAKQVLELFYRFVDALLATIRREDRSYFVIAIGCTGGRHRSVAVVNLLTRRLQEQSYEVRVVHRDLETTAR